MPSRFTNPVYKGDSGDLPLHFAVNSRHMHNKVRWRGCSIARGGIQLSEVWEPFSR